MAHKPMWMVRAEVGGKYFDDFKDKSIIAIGWDRLGDMSALKDRDAVYKAVWQHWPEMKKMQVAMSVGQLFRFLREMKIGDRVITYNPSRRVYLLGTIAGEYRYDASLIVEDPHVRSVNWDAEVSRDLLSVGTKNSLGAISTLFVVPPDSAKEIETAASGKPAVEFVAIQEEQEAAGIDDLYKDIQAKGIEFIKDRIAKLDWEEMQSLVAGILQAMGYKTRISPNGPDRGKDIVASPDGFGFESPRIVVEVKHRTGSQMGSQEIRSFLGGRHKDDKGLYVSTGGFTKDARYEAERAAIPLTLLDLDDLVSALLEHYGKMDIDMQRLIPLRKVYWPA